MSEFPPPQSKLPPPPPAPPPLQREAAAAAPLDEGSTGGDQFETVPPKDEADSVNADDSADAGDSVNADESDETDETDDAQVEPGARWWQARGALRNTEAFMGAMIVHLVLLVSLAVWMLPQVVREARMSIVVNTHATDEEAMDSLSQEILETATFSVLGADAMSGATGASRAGLVGAPSLDQGLVEQLSSGVSDLAISRPLEGVPSPTRLIEATPYGTLGDARVIVANYDDAFDRITQEILWMLADANVLVTWCFDQSESMKDDQKEIRARIHHVYSELGLVGQTGNDALTTAVTSYGQRYLQHTKRPTSNVEEIQDAMDTVPVDPSGKEFMCQAVALSIAQHLNYVRQGHRQMALIIVTDESGEREGNVQLLEQAIATARDAQCRIFVLGREAVFGYPYAHMKWKHPYTGHVHWLPIDRGPETAFVEQLQTDGFRRRHDAHPSGFGPYEQARMARETGGIFFMLPSLETDLVRGEKRLYELEAMRPYLPNLALRAQQLAERDSSVLRTMLCKIINDLNPYRDEVAKVMEVRYDFSANPQSFLLQAREEQAKATFYLQYLTAAEKTLAEISKHRSQEVSPRWQANYDLIYAQVLAYSARTYEYGAFLEAFIAEPKVVPLEKPNYHRLSSWHIEHSKSTVGGALTKPYIEQAAAMFQSVIEQHAGTPWAARAQWELSRGFGFDLRERYAYYGPRAPTTPRPSVPKIPIPNL